METQTYTSELSQEQINSISNWEDKLKKDFEKRFCLPAELQHSHDRLVLEENDGDLVWFWIKSKIYSLLKQQREICAVKYMYLQNKNYNGVIYEEILNAEPEVK